MSQQEVPLLNGGSRCSAGHADGVGYKLRGLRMNACKAPCPSQALPRHRRRALRPGSGCTGQLRGRGEGTEDGQPLKVGNGGSKERLEPGLAAAPVAGLAHAEVLEV